MKPKLYIVTGSKFKFEDLSLKLKDYFDCEQKEWNEPEIQGDPEEIIKHKARRAYEIFQHPVLVDDVSAHFEALNGFPGPYMKDFWKCFSPYEMGKKFADSRIKVVCRLGLCKGENDLVIAKGEASGTIISPQNIDHKGREFELFTILDGMDKIMLDYSVAEKNEFSHRGKAMKNLLEILKQSK